MNLRTKTLGAILFAGWLSILHGRPLAASEFEKFARPDQVAASDLILVGRVISVASAWAADHSAIYTDSELAIDEIWKGSADGDRIVVRTPGGTVGTIAAKIDGSAEFAVGESVLVFLKRSGSAFEPVGMRFGKYEIVGEGANADVVGNLPPAVGAAQKFDKVSLRLDEIRAEVSGLLAEKRR
jgi:hypothetical protein